MSREIDPAPSPSPNLGPFAARLRRAQAGDPEALEELFDEHYPTIERLVHKHLARDIRTARPWLAARFSTGDVVQEVCRSVLRDLRSFQGETVDRFIGLLVVLVRNRIVDAVRFHEAEIRDGRRSATTEDVKDPESSEHPAMQAAANEERARIEAALRTLSPRDEALVRARLEDTGTFRRLARQLGYSSVSAAQRAFYAAQARLTLQLRSR